MFADSDPRLVWTVTVDREAENAWRSSLGQASIDNWCAAHGWDANRILSGSVVVFGYADGQAFVNAEEAVRDKNGRPVMDHPHDRLKVRPLLTRLAQSLPEGIGEVSR